MPYTETVMSGTLIDSMMEAWHGSITSMVKIIDYSISVKVGFTLLSSGTLILLVKVTVNVCT